MTNNRHEGGCIWAMAASWWPWCRRQERDDTKLDTLIGAVAQLTAEVRNMAIDIAAEMAELTTEVSETRGQNASIIAHVQGLRTIIDEMVAGNDDVTALKAQLRELSASLNTGQQETADAIAANPLPGDPVP